MTFLTDPNGPGSTEEVRRPPLPHAPSRGGRHDPVPPPRPPAPPQPPPPPEPTPQPAPVPPPPMIAGGCGIERQPSERST